MKKSIIFGFFILIVLTVFLIYTRIQNQRSAPVVHPREYSSSQLGVRFSYLTEDEGKRVRVQEMKDRIYVFLEGTKATDGQYVQVYTKQPSQTLSKVIEREFLKGISPDDCFVKEGMDANGTKPDKGVAAIIAYPMNQGVNDDWILNAEKCPAEKSLTNGLSYFWAENETSDKFVFFSIGQYFLPGNNKDESWHETLHFYEKDQDPLNQNVKVSIGNANIGIKEEYGPAIIFSGKKVSVETAVNKPNTTDWKSACLDSLTCIPYPPTWDFCGLSLTHGLILQSSPCIGSQGPSSLDIENITDRIKVNDPDLLYVLAKDVQISTRNQFISDEIEGTISGTQVYCYDNSQSRYCKVTNSDSAIFFVTGAFYHQDIAPGTEHRDAFDAAVWALINR